MLQYISCVNKCMYFISISDHFKITVKIQISVGCYVLYQISVFGGISFKLLELGTNACSSLPLAFQYNLWIMS